MIVPEDIIYRVSENVECDGEGYTENIGTAENWKKDFGHAFFFHARS